MAKYRQILSHWNKRQENLGRIVSPDPCIGQRDRDSNIELTKLMLKVVTDRLGVVGDLEQVFYILDLCWPSGVNLV